MSNVRASCYYYALLYQEGFLISKGSTLSLVESFIESEVPHLRLFLMLSMMPLKRWVATENVLTALLGNEVWSKFFMLICEYVLQDY